MGQFSALRSVLNGQIIVIKQVEIIQNATKFHVKFDKYSLSRDA